MHIFVLRHTPLHMSIRNAIPMTGHFFIDSTFFVVMPEKVNIMKVNNFVIRAFWGSKIKLVTYTFEEIRSYKAPFLPQSL